MGRRGGRAALPFGILLVLSGAATASDPPDRPADAPAGTAPSSAAKAPTVVPPACPAGTVPAADGRRSWCMRPDGVPHGPLVVRDGSRITAWIDFRDGLPASAEHLLDRRPPARPAGKGGRCRPEDILQTVDRRRLEFRRSYETALVKQKDLTGRIDLRWRVGLTGAVVRVEVLENELGDEVSDCLQKAVRRMLFPPPAGGQCEIKFPVIFNTRPE